MRLANRTCKLRPICPEMISPIPFSSTNFHFWPNAAPKVTRNIGNRSFRCSSSTISLSGLLRALFFVILHVCSCLELSLRRGVYICHVHWFECRVEEMGPCAWLFPNSLPSPTTHPPIFKIFIVTNKRSSRTKIISRRQRYLLHLIPTSGFSSRRPSPFPR